MRLATLFLPLCMGAWAAQAGLVLAQAPMPAAYQLNNEAAVSSASLGLPLNVIDSNSPSASNNRSSGAANGQLSSFQLAQVVPRAAITNRIDEGSLGREGRNTKGNRSQQNLVRTTNNNNNIAVNRANHTAALAVPMLSSVTYQADNTLPAAATHNPTRANQANPYRVNDGVNQAYAAPANPYQLKPSPADAGSSGQQNNASTNSEASNIIANAGPNNKRRVGENSYITTAPRAPSLANANDAQNRIQVNAAKSNAAKSNPTKQLAQPARGIGNQAASVSASASALASSAVTKTTKAAPVVANPALLSSVPVTSHVTPHVTPHVTSHLANALKLDANQPNNRRHVNRDENSSAVSQVNQQSNIKENIKRNNASVPTAVKHIPAQPVSQNQIKPASALAAASATMPASLAIAKTVTQPQPAVTSPAITTNLKPNPSSLAASNTPHQAALASNTLSYSNPHNAAANTAASPSSAAANGSDNVAANVADNVALKAPVNLNVPAKPTVLTFLITPNMGYLSQALKHFARENGWTVAWTINRDFPIEFPASFTGDFLSVVEQVAASLSHTDTPIRIKVYEANQVLRVIYGTS